MVTSIRWQVGTLHFIEKTLLSQSVILFYENLIRIVCVYTAGSRHTER